MTALGTVTLREMQKWLDTTTSLASSDDVKLFYDDAYRSIRDLILRQPAVDALVEAVSEVVKGGWVISMVNATKLETALAAIEAEKEKP